MSESEKPRLEVDWVKVVAGALAAVSSAVLLSTLGAAGTLIGAALGSVVMSLATSVYGTGLARGTEKVAVAQTVALEKVTAATQQIAQVRRSTTDGTTDGTPEGTADGAEGDAPSVEDGVTPDADANATEVLQDAEQQLEEARAELEEAANPDAEDATSDGLSLKERLAIVPWKRVLLASAGLFVIAMVLLTSFEVIGGRTVSSYTGGSTDRDGGTSFGRTFRGGGGSDQQPEQDPTPTQEPSQAPTQEPSDQPTTDPTTEPSDEPTQTDDTETADPSEEPSESPTESPSPTRTPTTRVPSPTTTSPTR